MNSRSANDWDKLVWKDSFTEFKMQFQRFNPEEKYFTFGALLVDNPQAAQLHFLVGGSVLGYLKQLNGIIPDVVDNLGHRFMTIADCTFEIINSDVRDIKKHEVAFNFYSEPFLWHETVGGFLLISSENKAKSNNTEGCYDTHLFQIPAYVSIDKLNERL
ncbi:MAG: hypothetical protein JST17_05590 [Bacteroidetes bacterium]|nr:hypothetical protein [Bacteroidota bacterium]MBS1931293.1 hypothetical protein [Bacteroidota bacterium]